MLLLSGEELFCDTFLSLKRLLSLQRILLLIVSFFQMSQPEEARGCFCELANVTNILLMSQIFC